MTNQSESPHALAEPGSFTDTAFVYKFLPADISIGNLASRFQTEPEAICALNGNQSPTWTPAPGSSVLVPRPADSRFGDFTPNDSRWEPYSVTDESVTLSALLERLMKEGTLGSNLGSGSRETGVVSAAEALEIWHYWRNAVLRENILARTPSAAASQDGAAGGLAQFVVDGETLGVSLPAVDVVDQSGADAALLTKEDTIFLPLTPMAHHSVAVAPNAPATVDLTPSPLELVRRWLSRIDGLHQALVGIRAQSQTIQSECTEDIRILHKLRALVYAEQQQFSASAFIHADDGGRGALLQALDALVAKAPSYMLHSPQTTIDKMLGPKWRGALAKLRVELKKNDLRQLLDQVLPRSGEVVCVLNGVPDKRNFVETVCVTAARAAYWLAQSLTKEDRDLLLDAVYAVANAHEGTKPTAAGTKSLLSYAAGLAAAGKDFSASCGGAASVAYCGAVTKAYTISALSDPNGTPGVCLQNIDGAVSAVIDMDIDAYVVAEQREKGSRESTLTKANAARANLKEISEAREKVAEAEDLEEEEEVATRAALKSATPNLDARRRQFANPEQYVGTFPSRLGELYLFIGLGHGLAQAGLSTYRMFTSETTTETDVAIASTVQSGLDVACSAMESLKKLGILEESAGAEVAPFLGAASLLIGALLQFMESQEAFEAGRSFEGVAHIGEGSGMMVMFVGAIAGGPVFVSLGLAVLAVSATLAAAGEFPELFTNGPRASFHRNFERFKRYGKRFDKLADEILSVEQNFRKCVLPPLDSMQYDALREILEPAGFSKEELAH